MHDQNPDISEQWLNDLGLLEPLLTDQTRKLEAKPGDGPYAHNICWCTDDYAHLGNLYTAHAPINVTLIVGQERSGIIMPRVQKTRQAQTQRARQMAEVYTPAWICNKQNNVIDAEWFGREGVFSTETTDAEGRPTWRATEGRIEFGEGRTWEQYVKDTRLEITCGEAPYLVSRYDAASGEPIAVGERIGMLDRKLRVVSENTSGYLAWLRMALRAYRSVYGYEWQGDSLLLARENLLMSVLEHFEHRFGRDLLEVQDSEIGGHKPLEILKEFVRIITWNVWQMDGLKFVVPQTCHDVVEDEAQGDLFSNPDTPRRVQPCEGCLKDQKEKHNGIRCRIIDWASDPKGDKPEYFYKSVQ